jgi:TIR domain-containing protein/tetratricopeptide repeat protein
LAAKGNSDPTSYAAFISYAKADQRPAQQIAEGLEERGFKCWIAPRDVRPGRAYGDEIIRGIERAHAFILVLSSASNESIFVAREVERAISKNKAVFPVRVEDVKPAPSLEFFISSTQWIDAFSGRLAPHVDRLAHLLAEEEGRELPAVVSARPREWRQRAVLGTGVALVLGAAALGAFWLWAPAGDQSFNYNACLNLDGAVALKACDAALASGAFSGAEAANLHAMRGYQRHVKDDIPGALSDYDDAIARDPRLVMAFNNRGNIYRDLGQYDRALADYDRALALDPNKPDPLASRGWIYHQKGEVERAKADFTRALALNPDPSLKVKLEEAIAVLQPKKDPGVISDPGAFSNSEGVAAEVAADPPPAVEAAPAGPAEPPAGEP